MARRMIAAGLLAGLALAGLVEVDGNKLLGIEKQEVVAVEVEEKCSVKTRKGADVVEMPIPCTN